MSVQDFESFKERFKLSDSFIETIDSLFDKLVSFGYISRRKKSKLIDKLYDNIDSVYIGSSNLYDYKSGFYDANQKSLYIKDEKNIPAVYLRILYAINTKEIEPNTYNSGYSITKMRSDSYKMEYSNYGINRAVMANLVCKLYNSLPINVSYSIPLQEYTHNFLGYSITANNDIYAVEGKILSELCYALDINEEVFFEGMFSKNPIKFLKKIFKKKGFNEYQIFLKLLDEISMDYNKYNKIIYLSGLLNDNYLNIKKNVLKDDVTELIEQKKEIELKLITTINRALNINEDEEDEKTDVDSSTPKVTEALEFFENSLIEKLNLIQDMLSDKIIVSLQKLQPYVYASRLHQFCNMLIKPNIKLKEKVRDIILYHLIPTNEVMATNIVQKIRYAIILDLLSNEQFTSISKNFSFHIIQNFIDEEKGIATIIVAANKSFARMIEIRGLNNKIDDMELDVTNIPLDNLQYIMNSDLSNMYVDEIEKLYSEITKKFDYFKNVSLANMYMFEYLNEKYLIIYQNDKPYVAKIRSLKTKKTIDLLEVSDNFKVFEDGNNVKILNNKALPVLSKKNI